MTAKNRRKCPLGTFSRTWPRKNSATLFLGLSLFCPYSTSRSELKSNRDFTACETRLSTLLAPAGSKQSLQYRLSFQELHLGLKGAAKQLEPLQMRLWTQPFQPIMKIPCRCRCQRRKSNTCSQSRARCQRCVGSMASSNWEVASP